MLKKTITFEDLDGNKLTEDFYFNLSKAELAEMELGEAKHGGLTAVINKMIEETDGKKIIEMLNEIIKRSYGVRSDDNRRFIKNEKVWDDFYHTDAHSELLFELYTNATAASDFIRGIAPVDIPDADADGEMSPEKLKKLVLESTQDEKKS